MTESLVTLSALKQPLPSVSALVFFETGLVMEPLAMTTLVLFHTIYIFFPSTNPIRFLLSGNNISFYRTRVPKQHTYSNPF